MKRMHVHVGVEDIEAAVRFYSALFAEQPAKLASDYAKWMLEDPKLNFAISTHHAQGVNHLGIEAEGDTDLLELQARIDAAKLRRFDEPSTQCCYAESSKAWVADPDGLAWETFHTTGDTDSYGNEPNKADMEAAVQGSNCCN